MILEIDAQAKSGRGKDRAHMSASMTLYSPVVGPLALSWGRKHQMDKMMGVTTVSQSRQHFDVYLQPCQDILLIIERPLFLLFSIFLVSLLLLFALICWSVTVVFDF